jgi:hypothetical protein
MHQVFDHFDPVDRIDPKRTHAAKLIYKIKKHLNIKILEKKTFKPLLL